MQLHESIALLLDRILKQMELVGPLIELPLYYCDNGMFKNKNELKDKSEYYKDLELKNNYEIIDLLCYMEKKGLIKGVKGIIGYYDNAEDFVFLTRYELYKFNCKDTVFQSFSILIEVSKYDILEYLEVYENKIK